ncbi:MAG: SOS response-associated peptidase family protein, partial [Bacteroidales bacterium]|nr:SOS response-associated peptidase family protein [Bacteroidales bacterium]
MCFTVNVNLVKEELELRYGSDLLDPEKYTPSYYYHAFAFPELPTLRINDNDELKLSAMKWGLIPHWVSSLEEALDIRKKTPNARSETVAEKPSFKEAFTSRRCIVPVRGFYEWQKFQSTK